MPTGRFRGSGSVGNRPASAGRTVRGFGARQSRRRPKRGDFRLSREKSGKRQAGPRCANVSGLSLHANVCIPAKARRQLEKLCRYVARPAVATERLSILPDGRAAYRLRHKWSNGATHVLFEPLDLVAKLAALVPPPRFNLVRYHGIFSPGARWRTHVVPGDSGESSVCCSARKVGKRVKNANAKDGRKPKPSHPRNYSWSELMRRVFEIDVLACECGGRMRIVCAINPPEAIRKILDCLGLPSKPPPICSAVRVQSLAQ